MRTRLCDVVMRGDARTRRWGRVGMRDGAAAESSVRGHRSGRYDGVVVPWPAW